jgi:MFS family permease
MTAASLPVDAATTDRPARLRDDRDFVRYWLARTTSIAGTAATYVALPTLMYRLTESAFYTGVLTAIESVPYVVFGLIGGAVADRYDRRTIMVRSDLLNVLVLGSIPVAAAFGVLTVAHLLIAAALTSTLFVFFDAANFGALPTLVGKDKVPAANGAIWSAAFSSRSSTRPR